jgi:outer membrane protein
MKRTPVALSCAAMAVMLASSSAAFAAATPAPMASPTTVPTAEPKQTGTRPAFLPATLSLSQAEQIALASSPQLALARGVVNQEQAAIGVARSGYLPQISGAATTRRASTQISATNSKGQSASGPALLTENTGSLTLNQLILDGGRVNAEVQAARYTTDAAKLTLLRDIQTVLLNVAQDYYAALQARHQFQAAQQSLSVAQVQERLVEAQYHAGVASKADVLTAQLPVAQAELAVASAQNGEAENVASLLAAMGLEANTPVTLQDDTSVSASQPDPNEILSSALAERTDLSAAKASLTSAQAIVRATKLEWFPVISGSAQTGTGTTGFTALNYAGNWSLQASLAFPTTRAASSNPKSSKQVRKRTKRRRITSPPG